MFVTIINDCQDDNAFGRQLTKASALISGNVISVGVKNDLEAAGNLIDILDAAEGQEGVILVNVAPRHGAAKKWPNGTPFGYFFYKKTLVVSSIDGLTLSLVKKLGLVESINLLDIPTVINYLTEHHSISAEEVDHIEHTQFRSLEFIPRVAKWLLIDQIELPYESYSINEIPECPNAVWWIDNFGNCKTTLLPTDVDFESGKKVELIVGKYPCFLRLKDVPDDGSSALIIGSSGLDDRRFLELVIQGKSFQKESNIKSADLV